MRLVLVVAAVLLAGPAVAQSGPSAKSAPPATLAAPAPSIVYFDADSDSLSALGLAILDEVARQARSLGSAQVILSGHADVNEGPSDYNVGLSQRRANFVRDQLFARGVPASMIVTQAFGSSRPAIDEKGVAENRRVEVTFGPGSGW